MLFHIALVDTNRASLDVARHPIISKADTRLAPLCVDLFSMITSTVSVDAGSFATTVLNALPQVSESATYVGAFEV